MEDNFNKPERGSKTGLYQIENAEGDKVDFPAESFPQADALVRMGGKWIKSIEEWRADQLAKKATKAETSDKKGK